MAFWLSRAVTFLVCGLAVGGVSRAESLDDRLIAEARDGRLECFDFLSACLIAGGVNDAVELDSLLARHDELSRRIDPHSVRNLPLPVRIRDLHTRLHDDVLIGEYRQEASDLRVAFASGDYNCLSALALYLELCPEVGVELEIWSRPGHVYLVSAASGARIEPGSRAWAINAAGDDTGRLTPPARRITAVQLLGKFYYNRGVLLLQQGRYAEGIGLLRTSLVLDPEDREARGNLLAGLNNWAVALCRQQRFIEAAELIDQGLAIDSTFAPLVANSRYVRDKAGP